MSTRRTAGLLLGFALGLAAAAAAAGSDWVPGTCAKGDGYSCQLSPRESDDGLVHYRILGTVDATPEALVRAVRAVASDPARAPHGQTRRLLSQSAEGFVVYSRIDLPFPFDDRDIVTRAVSSADPASGVHRIHWETIVDVAAPASDGVIRINRAEGFWEFAPAEGAAATNVSYETYMDLGGSLPGWLIQGMLGGAVVESFEKVAREAQAP